MCIFLKKNNFVEGAPQSGDVSCTSLARRMQKAAVAFCHRKRSASNQFTMSPPMGTMIETLRSPKDTPVVGS